MLLLIATLACFKPYEDLAALDFSEVPFDIDLVESTAHIRTVTTTLRCPDGQDARFYVVYQPDVEGPVPMALGFHPGAFDYVIDPYAESTSALFGATWRSSSRMNRDWADLAVWASLGMYPGDFLEGEVHEGALPAALINEGVAQLWPANCWGDLWHNEEGFQENDFAREGLTRNGRTLAWWMLRYAYEPDFAASQGVELPFEASDELYLVGLGEGGRAVTELLLHEGLPRVSGALVDSAPDTLSAYFDPTNELDAEAEGLRRLWPTEEQQRSIDDWSLLSLSRSSLAPPLATDTDTDIDTDIDTGSVSGLDGAGAFRLPEHLAFVWSAADPRQPLATMQSTAEALSDRPEAWVLDRRERAHVFSNVDAALAQELVHYLRTGERTQTGDSTPP